MKPRRIRNLVVTGGAGFIGSHFVELAAREGINVLVYDALTYAGRRENLQEGLEGKWVSRKGGGRVELVVGNICDADKVREILNSEPFGAPFDGLMNFAAESHVDRSITGPGAFVQTNIVGTHVLLEAAKDFWKRHPEFVYLQVSTDEVFGSLGPKGKFSEKSRIEPNSPYSASKAAADHLVRAAHHTYGLPTVTTHCSNNYGPRQFPEKLIPFMITNALQGKPLGVYGNGKNVRDWIHVVDHCRGLLLALRKGRSGGVYCFGGNAERSNIQLVKLLCREMDRLHPRADGRKHETAIQFVTDRLGHDFRYAIDNRLARKELGFRPKFTFEKGLRETLKAYLA